MVKIQVVVGPFPDFEMQIRILNDPEELQREGIKAVEKSEKLLQIIIDKINAKFPGLSLEFDDMVEYHIDKEKLEQQQSVVEEFEFEFE